MITIAVVGGPDRLAPTFETVAKVHGHRVEHHDGSAAGRGLQSLEAMIGRADLVVIITRINSHAAVLHARELVRKRSIPSLLCRTFGVAQLTRLLQAVTARLEGELGSSASMRASPRARAGLPPSSTRATRACADHRRRKL
jgi:uncharacterized protein DUF2325